jgi:hypothetical protein
MARQFADSGAFRGVDARHDENCQEEKPDERSKARHDQTLGIIFMRRDGDGCQSGCMCR